MCFVELFWTAPEHLRQTLGKGVPYSQKGDVFSFAIILQEICTRSEPYEGNHLDVEGRYHDIVRITYILITDGDFMGMYLSIYLIDIPTE